MALRRRLAINFNFCDINDLCILTYQTILIFFFKVDFLYQFWKLKRKANFNRPLVTLKRDEVDNLAQQEQDVLYRRLKLFTHLRQDLERVSSTS